MVISTVTTLKLTDLERDKLFDAIHILDNMYSQDVDSAIRFNVSNMTLVDTDDIAEMMLKLITISDANETIRGELDI